MNSLNEKVVVITGGGGVLCSHFAKTLSMQGALVAVLDLNEAAACQVAAEIVESGGKAIGVACNVLKKESIEKAKDIILSTYGKIDILINGAGGNNPKGTTSNEEFSMEDLGKEDFTTFFDLDPDGISFVFNLNFIGTLLPTQVFAKEMLQNEGACILNISSMNAFRPLTKIPAYSAAKAAVSNFTQWLAVHFAKSGIRVNALAPGFFVTNQNYALLFDKENNPTQRAKKILNHTPMGRFGVPEDLNGTLLWLCDSAQSQFVTGIVVPIDGGFSAYSGV